MNSPELDALNQLSHTINLLDDINACVYLDMETASPAKSIGDKGDQLAYLSGLIHQAKSNPQIPQLIEKLEAQDITDDTTKAVLKVAKREYRDAVALPKEFVVEKSKLDSESLEAWKQSRKEKDFGIFLPFLEKQIEMARRIAGYYGYSCDETYNGLLDIYEPGSSTAMYDALYIPIKDYLVKTIPLIIQKQKAEGSARLEFANMDQLRQESLSHTLLTKIGYDFNRGRLVQTVHPFTITLGFNDVRVSTRYSSDSLEFISSVIHEGGHGMYEQGIADSLKGSWIGRATSTGFHESQSRIMEVFAGQTDEFWHGALPEVVSQFPDQMNGVSLKQWTDSLKLVQPSKIRVDADSVTYGLHIIIRYELEKDLISGKLAAKDLPQAWNAKYKEYLGVVIEDDAEGCLQDIHWSDGSFGYFPTYLYGSMIAAQIWTHYTEQNPQWQEEFKAGNYLGLREWLRVNFHQYGAVYTTDELLQKAFGESLSPKYFESVIETKYLS
jgi:carboxypeptidase Taq